MDSGELSIGGMTGRTRRRRVASSPSRAARAAHIKPVPQPNLYPAGVTIIICTFNRLALLKKMVDSIRPQLPMNYPLEVLIVDNNSTDGTADYVRGLRLQDDTFSYFLETKQGLSHARNGGAQAAKYDFLFYADDDAFLSPNFLRSMGGALSAHDPDLFGGPCLPDYVDPKPAWFPELLEVRRKAETSGFYNNVTLSGSSFGIRRSVLERIGGFNPQFGMTGKRPGMLEERLAIEAYRRTTPAAEQKVYYSVESFVYHYTPKSRMRVGFQLRRIYQANFNYIKYCLEQGVRSPALLYGTLAKRLVGETLRFAAALPSMWRERAAKPDRAMNELVRVVFRLADAHAALLFLATDWGRTRRRLEVVREARPLNIVVLHAARPDGAAPHLDHLSAALRGHNVTLFGVTGLTNKEVRAKIESLNPRSVDLIVTDTLKVMSGLDPIRAHLPQIQIALWARDPRSFTAAQRPWTQWRNPGALLTQLWAMRRGARSADQVIWSATPGGRIARHVLGAREWKTVREDDAQGWRAIVDEARIWAPRRLSP